MFRKKSFPLAIDIGSHAVKLVQLVQGKKGLVLGRLGMATLAYGAVADGEVLQVVLAPARGLTDLTAGAESHGGTP